MFAVDWNFWISDNEQIISICRVDLYAELHYFLNMVHFHPQIKAYEKIENKEERRKVAREIYDNFIMKELLSNSHAYNKESVAFVQKHLTKNEVPTDLFEVSSKIPLFTLISVIRICICNTGLSAIIINKIENNEH